MNAVFFNSLPYQVPIPYRMAIKSLIRGKLLIPSRGEGKDSYEGLHPSNANPASGLTFQPITRSSLRRIEHQ
jgi:hypothetical protein